MGFEWDEDKNRENIRKHGIDFTDVPEMFNYELLESLDDRTEHGEDRWIAIGLLRGRIVVVYTEKQADVIRLISKATTDERQHFEQFFADRLGPH
jgi:uncharacterized protein